MLVRRKPKHWSKHWPSSRWIQRRHQLKKFVLHSMSFDQIWCCWVNYAPHWPHAHVNWKAWSFSTKQLVRAKHWKCRKHWISQPCWLCRQRMRTQHYQPEWTLEAHLVSPERVAIKYFLSFDPISIIFPCIFNSLSVPIKANSTMNEDETNFGHLFIIHDISLKKLVFSGRFTF